MTCGSEFIRETSVPPPHPYRSDDFFANDFAPIGVSVRVNSIVTTEIYRFVTALSARVTSRPDMRHITPKSVQFIAAKPPFDTLDLPD